MIMMKRYKKILLTGVLSALSCSFVHAQELYKNENAPVHERVMDLISRLTVEEKISLLRATSPGIPRLGIDKYYHGNEALHGVLFLMRRVPVGTSWIREENRKNNSAMC